MMSVVPTPNNLDTSLLTMPEKTSRKPMRMNTMPKWNAVKEASGFGGGLPSAKSVSVLAAPAKPASAASALRRLACLLKRRFSRFWRSRRTATAP